MTKYSLILSENFSPNTKIPISELLVNGKGPLEIFEEKHDGNAKLITQLARAVSIVEQKAMVNGFIHNTKLKVIETYKNGTTLYEAKYQDVRLYFCNMKQGEIVILASLKNSQKKDIRSIKNLLSQEPIKKLLL